MQSTALVFGEVITPIVSNELHDSPIRQGRGFVENEPPPFDTRLETTHASYCKGFQRGRQALTNPA